MHRKKKKKREKKKRKTLMNAELAARLWAVLQRTVQRRSVSQRRRGEKLACARTCVSKHACARTRVFAHGPTGADEPGPKT